MKNITVKTTGLWKVKALNMSLKALKTINIKSLNHFVAKKLKGYDFTKMITTTVV
jgi:hypothetical protein